MRIIQMAPSRSLSKRSVTRIDETEPYFTEQQFCERFRVTQRTAERWRRTGSGPPFVRLGPRKYIYPLNDLKIWTSARTFGPHAVELLHAATHYPVHENSVCSET